MFKDVSNRLRQAYEALEQSDKAQALMLCNEALRYAQLTDNRVLRAHVAQCVERVRGTL